MQNHTIPNAIITAVKNDAVIAYATEAVFGLGCHPESTAGLERLLALKQRPVEKGLILIAASIEQLNPFADFDALSDSQYTRMKGSWPGPVTWVVPAKPHLSRLLTGGRATIAVRVSPHAQVHALCTKLGHPLTSTSANKTGLPPCRTVSEVRAQFATQVPILEGSVGPSENPTEIRDARTGEILRVS